MNKKQKVGRIYLEDVDDFVDEVEWELRNDTSFNSPLVGVVVNDKLDYFIIERTKKASHTIRPCVRDALRKLDELLYVWQLEFQWKLKASNGIVPEQGRQLNESKETQERITESR